MQVDLIPLLLNKEFYAENKHLVRKDMFTPELLPFYEVVVKMQENNNKTYTIQDLKYAMQPYMETMPNARKELFRGILGTIKDSHEEKTFDPDNAREVLSHVWRNEICTLIADKALAITEGKASLNEIEGIIKTHGADFLPKVDIPSVTTDLFELLEEMENAVRWEFNLNRLQVKTDGVGPGELCVVGARPNVGKTAFLTSIVAGPGGFLDQGAKVMYIGNEEPVKRTMFRCVQAKTGMTRDQVMDDKKSASILWGQVSKKFIAKDSIDLTLEQVEGLVKREQPDILMIDQLDKVRTDKTFAREDQTLRYIYTNAREIAKRYNVAVFGISQLSSDAEGKATLNYSMFEGSKTGKAAEADLMILIGKLNLTDEQNEEDPTRYINICKNKITGWHGKIIATIDGKVSRYVDA